NIGLQFESWSARFSGSPSRCLESALMLYFRSGGPWRQPSRSATYPGGSRIAVSGSSSLLGRQTHRHLKQFLRSPEIIFLKLPAFSFLRCFISNQITKRALTAIREL